MDNEVPPSIQMGSIIRTSWYVSPPFFLPPPFLREVVLNSVCESIALERATQTSLMRFHLTNSKQEQESYLSQVEKHRVSSRITDKAASRAQGKKSDAAKEGEGEGEEKEGKNKRKKREFKQRQAVEKGGNGLGEGGDEESRGERKGSRKELENVLGRLF